MFKVLLISFLPIIASVTLHYYALGFMYEKLPKLTLRARANISLGFIGALLTHITETFIFAVCLFWLDHVTPGSALLSTLAEPTFGDYSYYSFVVYTSLGFGDIVPTGVLRTFTALEVLTGLILIAWTASFMYLQMQRYWGNTKD